MENYEIAFWKSIGYVFVFLLLFLVKSYGKLQNCFLKVCWLCFCVSVVVFSKIIWKTTRLLFESLLVMFLRASKLDAPQGAFHGDVEHQFFTHECFSCVKRWFLNMKLCTESERWNVEKVQRKMFTKTFAHFFHCAWSLDFMRFLLTEQRLI